MILELKGVSAAYKNKLVLDSIDLKVDRGELFAIYGENGSGKSTLLKIIGKLKRLKSGEVLFNGKPIDSISNYNELVGYVPQENLLISNLTVAENINLFYNINRDGKFLKREYILDTLDLIAMEKEKVKNLSGGMQKRTSVACALLKNPELLLLDEPLASLDFKLRDIIANIIKEYTRNGGTAMMSTHYLDGIEKIDKIAIIKDKKLVLASEISKSEIERLFYGGQLNG